MQLSTLMQRALAAQTAGDLATARQLYEHVVTRAPGTVDALHMLAVVCYQMWHLDDAYAYIRRALDLTDWRIEPMRRNLELIVSAALVAQGSDAVPPMRADRLGAGTGPSVRDRTEPASRIGGRARMSNPAQRASRDGRAAPGVSVLVSTYNAAAHLLACLEDLAMQSIADALEIIVIDSGSQQDEHKIVKAYEPRFANLVYVRTRRETLFAAWNRGLALATGEYVTNANTDDAHRADALELLAAALDDTPDADFAYSDYLWSTRANDTFAKSHASRTVRHHTYHPAQAMFYCVLGCHPMWRRSLFDDLGPFDAELTTVGDYEMLLRAVLARRRPVQVREALSLFYQNPEGLTFGSDRARHEIAALQKRYRGQMPIDSLFAFDDEDPTQVAAAWTALGAMATGIAVPWLDTAHRDMRYAAYCFRHALNVDDGYAPAIANLATLLANTGHAAAVDVLLARLPRDRAAALALRLAGGEPSYETPEIPAAVPPLEHAGVRAAA